MGFSSTNRNKVSGYTLLELAVVMLIIAILALLSVVGYGAYKRHVEKVQCLTQLRTIHLGLATHVADRHYWPQPPMGIDGLTEEDWFGWWTAQLVPFGVEPEVWLCPTDRVDPEEEKPRGQRGSYVPTVFDTGRYTPYRWAQPWLMERGDMHGKGAHIVMPNGEITTSQQVR